MKVGTALLGLLFSGGIALVIGRGVATTGVAPEAPARIDLPVAQHPSSGEERWRVFPGSSPVRGDRDALVTVAVLADLECPYSMRAMLLLGELERAYAGQLSIVFKHFPLAAHPGAVFAAEWAAAAGEQGLFWAIVERSYAALAQGAPATPADLRRFLTEAGGDVARAEASLAEGGPRGRVAEDRALGDRLGVASTPAVFVNGVRLTGAPSRAALERAIDAELAVAKDLVAGGIAPGEVYRELMRGAREVKALPAKRPEVARQTLSTRPGAPRRGGREPLVVVVEFADFECPYCNRATELLAELERLYGERLAIEFRHMPLPFHARALPAARAAAAAHRQGRFWAFHDALFAAQAARGDAPAAGAGIDPLGAAGLEQIASRLGLDLPRFARDRDDPALAAEIERDREEGERLGVRGTPTFFVNGVAIRGAQPIGAVRAVVDRELARAERALARGVPAKDVYGVLLREDPGSADDAPPGEQPAGIELGAAPLLGSAGAPIKVVVFSDFECPHCATAAPMIRRAAARYGSRVAVAFKHYPLPIHPNAELASVAALAAARQGKFWEYHDALYAALRAGDRALDRETLVTRAAALGLDPTRLRADLDDPALRLEVKRDISEGVRLGVTATPTIYVNQRQLLGLRSDEDLASAIEEALGAAR